ncbi:unnamed protein product [Notodromas monacha]|uniref:Uncharacterized protein n=1 Tax=Notodromas monacha TaxID=399045 RepID=A0A7R9BIP4_9CRUS|nr:unnamed protein product [Notodromas monacha]CAG0916236.1 unnamed protein product [Notodromas monacha]
MEEVTHPPSGCTVRRKTGPEFRSWDLTSLDPSSGSPTPCPAGAHSNITLGSRKIPGPCDFLLLQAVFLALPGGDGFSRSKLKNKSSYVTAVSAVQGTGSSASRSIDGRKPAGRQAPVGPTASQGSSWPRESPVHQTATAMDEIPVILSSPADDNRRQSELDCLRLPDTNNRAKSIEFLCRDGEELLKLVDPFAEMGPANGTRAEVGSEIELIINRLQWPEAEWNLMQCIHSALEGRNDIDSLIQTRSEIFSIVGENVNVLPQDAKVLQRAFQRIRGC